jgi:hypothetical protein
MILDKYKEKLPHSALLPQISNQKMNSYLKEIGDLCGIGKNLTTHLARHTFATTTTLSKGVPIETVSKMLGHAKIQTAQIYDRITDINSPTSCQAFLFSAGGHALPLLFHPRHFPLLLRRAEMVGLHSQRQCKSAGTTIEARVQHKPHIKLYTCGLSLQVITPAVSCILPSSASCLTLYCKRCIFSPFPLQIILQNYFHNILLPDLLFSGA